MFGAGRQGASAGHGQALGREPSSNRKATLFEDDAAFLVEVHEGRSQAPGMDPQLELQTLKMRFSDFKREFQGQLAQAFDGQKLLASYGPGWFQ